jgi:pectin methylesterase-like acyl-CoA thioesterase
VLKHYFFILLCVLLFFQGAQSSTNLYAQDMATHKARSEKIAPNAALHVSPDGNGDYSSVQKAVDAAPSREAMIVIAPGIYRETVSITKPNIHLRGSNQDASEAEIVFDRSAGTSGARFIRREWRFVEISSKRKT